MAKYTLDKDENIVPVTEQGLVPAVPQEQLSEEQPVEESKWGWVGSDSHPEAKENEDGISDLFKATDQEEIDEDMRDLTDVDIEKDVLDADDDGTLDSLTDVTRADVMGDEEITEVPRQPRYRRVAPRRIVRPRYQPPTSAGGMRG